MDTNKSQSITNTGISSSPNRLAVAAKIIWNRRRPRMQCTSLKERFQCRAAFLKLKNSRQSFSCLATDRCMWKRIDGLPISILSLRYFLCIPLLFRLSWCTHNNQIETKLVAANQLISHYHIPSLITFSNDWYVAFCCCSTFICMPPFYDGNRNIHPSTKCARRNTQPYYINAFILFCISRRKRNLK